MTERFNFNERTVRFLCDQNAEVSFLSGAIASREQEGVVGKNGRRKGGREGEFV